MSFTSVVCLAPYWAASFAALSSIESTTTTSSAPAVSLTLPECTMPIRPAPITPIRKFFFDIFPP